MESATDTTTFVRELTIAARPETVWEFLVDPERAKRWMGIDATFAAEPGGLYQVTVLPGHVAKGEFVELDPPRRLVLTWGWESGEGSPPTVPPGSSTIEIELEPEGGGTRLRFVHSGLPGEAEVASHAHGWDHYLPRLVVAAGGGDPGRDPWLDGDM